MWQNVSLQTIIHFQGLGNLDVLVKSQCIEKQWIETLEDEGGGGKPMLQSRSTAK